MTDEKVRAALRSEARLVVVEAPAGCGKTYLGAEYARHVASENKRPLILTHTHAACSVFAERTSGLAKTVEIRTIDSLIASIARAYHLGLGLPADIEAWIRDDRDGRGHSHVASKVGSLLMRHPMIAASLARRHSVVICDEHQDSSGDQHSVTTALLKNGASVRVFGDPMQAIFKQVRVPGGHEPWNWDTLGAQAHAFEQLATPHRWRNGSTELGDWTLLARNALKRGGQLDLRSRPPSVQLVFAENTSPVHGGYQLSAQDRQALDAFERKARSLLLLTRRTATVLSLRSFFNRRLPLWEGHTRDALDTLAAALRVAQGNPEALADCVVKFMGAVGKGFTESAFGKPLKVEIRAGCARSRKGKPAHIQDLARFLISQPDHRGVANALARINQLKEEIPGFSCIHIDCFREFWEATRVGQFEAMDVALREIARRRTFARPLPPARAISTIHKAKGLECDDVAILPCDAETFPDNHLSRCLLYVAISRARKRLLIVASRQRPSPLLAL